MLRVGPSSGEIRNMSGEDIFSSRLKLLIIMAKAYLTGCPIGKYRKQAIIENSRYVFYHSLQLVNKIAFFKDQDLKVQAGIAFTDDMHEEHIFYQRTQLLAVMVKALADGRLKGHFREKALKENLNRICEAFIFNFNVKDVKFLKVA
ncbi:MAG: hypothetical protein MUO88_12405 [Desulfobacterales bacterium]|nr:hypothetical protein [Desulfobacterales bacterium]